MKNSSDINATNLEYTPLPSTASLNTYAQNNISALIALDQKLEETTEKKEIALLLIQQKRILQQLKKDASRGNAILGLAVLKGMIVTGMDFHKFFDYTASYVDNRGYDKRNSCYKSSI